MWIKDQDGLKVNIREAKKKKKKICRKGVRVQLFELVSFCCRRTHSEEAKRKKKKKIIRAEIVRRPKAAHQKKREENY